MRFVRKQSAETGSALIALLIAALIIAILWTVRYRGRDKETAETARPGIQSMEDIPKTLDKAREAEKQQSDSVRELNKRMVDINQNQ